MGPVHSGLHDLLEIMLESMMLSERREYLREDGLPGDKGNVFRLGHTYGQGRTLTFRIPRDRYGDFYQRILAVLLNQEDVCDRLVGTLYSKGAHGNRWERCSMTSMVSIIARQHIKDAGLSEERCSGVAGTQSEGILSNPLHRLRHIKILDTDSCQVHMGD